MFGVLSLGVYYLVFNFLFGFLYFSFDVKPQLDYCRTFIEGDSCNLLVYPFLLLMELPLVVIAFAIAAILMCCAPKHISFNNYLVVLGYMFSYACMVLLSPYGQDTWLYIISVSVYQGLVFLGILWIVQHLTSKGIGRRKRRALL